jgi:excisionase family DNA binding protein
LGSVRVRVVFEDRRTAAQLVIALEDLGRKVRLLPDLRQLLADCHAQFDSEVATGADNFATDDATAPQSQSQPTQSELMSYKQAAKFTGVSRRTLERRVREGSIVPDRTLGPRSPRFLRGDLAQLIEREASASAGE